MTQIDFNKPFRIRQAAVVGSRRIEPGTYTKDEIDPKTVAKIPPHLVIQGKTQEQNVAQATSGKSKKEAEEDMELDDSFIT